MGETSAQVVQQVEEVIRHKLTAVAEREYSAAGGTKALAEILNHSDRTTERNVLEKLATTDKDLAEEVRGMLFVFEDIVKLEERAVQQVLREADQKDLVLALRGAPENVKEVVLTNMSERGAEMLKEEMEIQPPQRKRDIDAAQSRIVAVVRKLEEAGTIVIAGDERGGERSGCLRRPSATTSSSSSPPIRRRATRTARMLAQAHRRGRADPRAARARRATRRAAPPGHEQGAARSPAAARALGEAAQGVEALREETLRRSNRTPSSWRSRSPARSSRARSRRARSSSSRSCRERCGGSATGARSRCSSIPPTSRSSRGAIGELTAQGSGVELCDVQSDERVEPGGAIVRTAEGEVDASVHTQLERAREVRRGARCRRRRARAARKRGSQ